MKKQFIFLLGMIMMLGFLSETKAQPVFGRIIDIENGEPMPGVAIEYNQSLRRGTISDNLGNFTIPDKKQIETVVISFIGYKTLRYTVVEIPQNGTRWVIMLEPDIAILDEVKVVAGENPALRIVRKAINMRKINNPRFYPTYTYLSYNKDVVTYKMELSDSATAKEIEQFMRDTALAQERHMLVIESVTRKWYKSPNRNKEEVIGTKISGFRHPGVATTPDAVQNFAFHENIIPLVNKKYLNPLADGADKHYVYILKDTLYDAADTIFVMDYFPERGSNFEGFKGEMHIHTKKWGLVYVTAFPFDEGKINIHLEQRYTWVNNKYWFPRQLNYELELERVPFRNQGATMRGKTTLDSVQIGVEIRDDFFDHIAVSLNKKAAYVADDFWDKYRTEQLSVKEQETYRQMDSIGDRYKFDELLKGTRNLYQGFIAVGKLDVEISKLVAYNQYEGLRTGLGLYTNEDISEKFRIGGYFGYGSFDQAWKYGGSFRWYFNRLNDFYITASYLNDVRDPGGIRLRYYEWGNVAQQFFNKLMDKVEETEVTLTFRANNYTLMRAGVRHFTITPTYDYVFLNNNLSEPANSPFSFTEAQLGYRWQHKEKYSTNYGQRISQGSKHPVVSFIYSRGINLASSNQFEYNKFELGMLYDRYIPKVGRLRFSFEGGIVDRALPWSMNFSGRPSYNPNFSVVIKETFQTMRFNEFSSDRYASFFFMHDFGPLLLRYKHFKPEIRIAYAMMYGSLREPERHVGVPFKTLEKGFYESGLIVDNLLRFNMLNTGYLGIGLGAFYRYGPNRLPDDRENWTIKISFMYSVN